MGWATWSWAWSWLRQWERPVSTLFCLSKSFVVRQGYHALVGLAYGKRLGPWWPKFGLLARWLGRLNLREPRCGELRQVVSAWQVGHVHDHCRLAKGAKTAQVGL
ncbi:hypothetical protein L3X38_013722 [Prunus dulcis]|uniref:Secreted protein n=1 Tax=Prunus dulcis TaxID=3755 RepID=A0AAD4WLV1_PRUDU|nr:hypothetical protein L3X38_013722 [Prunus dulcis]